MLASARRQALTNLASCGSTCSPTPAAGTIIASSVTEFLILQALATRPGVVKARDALMDAAYDDQVYVGDRTIDSHIKRLRKKFKQADGDFEWSGLPLKE